MSTFADLLNVSLPSSVDADDHKRLEARAEFIKFIFKSHSKVEPLKVEGLMYF